MVALALFLGLLRLGTWQVERLAWKRDLISKVDARAHAAPVPAPRAEWPALTPDNAEYRRVSASGSYLYDKQTLVQAATELGSGYWVMTRCGSTAATSCWSTGASCCQSGARPRRR